MSAALRLAIGLGKPALSGVEGSVSRGFGTGVVAIVLR